MTSLQQTPSTVNYYYNSLLFAIKIIMSLLDQLFQNSCRNQQSALSLLLQSPVSMQQPLNSIIQKYSPQKIKMQSPGKGQSLTLNRNCRYASVVSSDLSHSQSRIDFYDSYKEKLSKLSKVMDAMTNKIRKIKYEFFIRLENIAKVEDACPYPAKINYIQYNNTLAKEQEKQMRINDGFQIISRIFKEKQKKFALEFVQLMSCIIEEQNRVEIFTLGKERQLKYNFITTLKGNHKAKTILTRKRQKMIIFPQLKSIKQSQLLQQPFPYSFSAQQSNVKVNPIFPQRPQVQNIDYSYNASIFLIDLDQRDELFREHQINDCMNSGLSIKKDRFGTAITSSFNQFQDGAIIRTPTCKLEKRASNDTMFSGVTPSQSQRVSQQKESGSRKSEVNSHNFAKTKANFVFHNTQNCLLQNPKTRQFLESSQNEYLVQEQEEEGEGEITNVRRSSSKDRESIKKYFCPMSIDQEIQITKRELNALITYRKQKEERRYSTLQEIQKSKEIIQQLVAEFKEGREAKEKQKIKLMLKKRDRNNQSASNREKIPKTAVKRSNSQLGGLSARKNYNSLQKPNNTISMPKSIKTRRQRASDCQIVKNSMPNDEDYVPYSQRDIDIYSQYMKAKKVMHSSPASNGKKINIYAFNKGNEWERMQMSNKKDNIQNILLSISKFPPCTERRIDLKIDLIKQNRSNNQQTTEKLKKGVNSQHPPSKIKINKK